MALEGHVRIPFDIIDARIVREQVIHDAEDEVLYGRVAQVEDELGAATALRERAGRGVEDPLRMLLVKLGFGIGHLGLDPDTEADLVARGRIDQPLDAVRQFAGVDLPVAQGTVVDVARILDAEPAVVHDEEFAAHARDVGHHLVHGGLIDVEVDAFPAVQQDLALLVAMGDPVGASPAVEVAGGAAQAFPGPGESEFRGAEGLAAREFIGAVVGADAGEEPVVIGVVRDGLQVVIAAVA